MLLGVLGTLISLGIFALTLFRVKRATSLEWQVAIVHCSEIMFARKLKTLFIESNVTLEV